MLYSYTFILLILNKIDPVVRVAYINNLKTMFNSF